MSIWLFVIVNYGVQPKNPYSSIYDDDVVLHETRDQK